MKLRDMFTEKPARVATVGGGVLLVVLALMAFRLRGSSAPGATRTQAYFTIDDGKTWFRDDASQLPPFEKLGKQAVLARVYRCEDGTTFVNHLERFTPDARQALQEARMVDVTGKNKPDQNAIRNAYTGGREVKRPGDTKWIAISNYRDASRVTNVKCPHGGASAVAVEP